MLENITFKQLSLACTGCPIKTRCGGCNASCNVNCFCEGDCPECGRLCCGHKILKQIMHGLNDLSILDVSVPHGDAFELPPFLPQAMEGIKGPPIRSSPVVISAKSIYSRRRPYNVRKILGSGGLRRRYNLPEQSKLILFNNTKDKMIENVWRGLSDSEIFRDYLRLGITIVSSPSYSIYPGNSRLEHMLAMTKSALFFQFLRENGIPAILHIFSFRREDTVEWATFLKRNSSIDHITTCMQLMKGDDRLFISALSELQHLIKITDRKIHLTFAGVAKPSRIAELVAGFDSITIVNGKAAALAMKHKRILFSTDTLKFEASPMVPSDLFEANTDMYRKIVDFFLHEKRKGNLEQYLRRNILYSDRMIFLPTAQTAPAQTHRGGRA